MKRIIYLSLIVVLCSNGILAQVPEKFNYQAVIRNASNELLSNRDVSIKVSILDEISSTTGLYSEEHTVSTNAYGLVNLEIGDGTIPTGNFSTINWDSGERFLKIEIDENGGSSYTEMGVVQLLSVPYALYAKSANNLGDENIYTPVTDTLFVVKDNDGNVVFAVFPDGAAVYVNEASKGKVGGFAVSGRTSVKGIEEEYLRVTPDSTRVYVNEDTLAKGKVGGFAVSGRTSEKGTLSSLMDLTKDNYFIGHKAGESITTGLYNIMLGYESGLSNQSGSYNTFLGYQSGYLNNANYNSFLGYLSGRENTSGEYNTFMGYESGRNNNGGDYNVFLGHQTGFSNTSGHENVFIGYRSGYSNTGGYDNIFIGNLAGENASGNTHSTFIGNEAGRNVTGDDNIYIGDRAGTNVYVANHESFGTVILGIDAGRNVVGESNTVLGYGTGSSWGGESTGNYNTFVGAGAGGGGHLARLGSNNVCIGNDAGYGEIGNDKLYIANNSTTTLIYGDFAAQELYIDGDLYATSVTPSDFNLKQNFTEIKSGLKLISALTGYYFNWNDIAKEEFNYSDEEQIGVIAQDVEKVLPQLIVTNSKGYKAVDYTKLSPVIIEAIKEQQTQIDELKSENEVLKQKLDEIIEKLNN